MNSVVNGNYAVYTGNQNLSEVGNHVRLYDSTVLVLDSDLSNIQSLVNF